MIPRACLRTTIALVAFSLIALGLCPKCLAQKTLAWKFRKGSVTNLLIEQDTNLQLENAGSAKLATNQTQQLQTTNISWIVKDISPEGIASIEQTIHRVQLDLKSSVGNFVVDTSNNQPLTGLGEVMAKGIRPLAGSRFLVKTKSDGEAAEVVIPVDVKNKLDEGSGALSVAGLKEIAANGTLRFPTKPIDVGENWTAQYEMDMPPFGKLIVNTTYQYLGEENLSGKVLDRIKATTAVRVADAISNSGLKLTSQESGGMVWFDNNRGMIEHSEFKQEMSMKLLRPSLDPTKPSLDLKQVIKQTMKLRYTPEQ